MDFRQLIIDVKPTQEIIVITVYPASISNVLNTQAQSGVRRLLQLIDE